MPMKDDDFMPIQPFGRLFNFRVAAVKPSGRRWRVQIAAG
jgi:hypothetical protein